MFSRQLFVPFLTLVVLLCGCTVNMDQPAQETAPALSSPRSNPVPPLSTVDPAQRSATLPVTWADLKLSGRLIYLAGFQMDNNPYVQLENLDLVSGVVTTLYQSPPTWWISAASVSPDENQVALSYATPTNFPAIYLMPLDGTSTPRLLFSPPTKTDEYIEPVWSPDGRFIYFAHINFGVTSPVFEIERIASSGGTPEKVVGNATWPRLSPDGSRLVYVSQNPNDRTDRLFTSAPDGGDPQQVELKGPMVPTIIDAPFFSPDGKSIFFSGPAPASEYTPSWLDQLLGIQVASAHSLPEDWWSVETTGGVPRQLTHIQSPSLYGSISPDGRLLASFSSDGIFVMGPDGSQLTLIVPAVGGIPGTVNWIP